MSTYQHNCNGTYRNEGWTVTGATYLHSAWNDVSDSSYASNPANKGRAAVTFPQDITAGNIPDGANIESVSVYIRVNKTDSASRSVTINLLSTQDTSHNFQRTLYPTTTITTMEVGTYTKDPLGKTWTKDRLNRLMLQAFSYDGVAAKVRIYEVYAVVNFRNKPVVTVTEPSGTVDTAAPVVSWTYTQEDGDPQQFAEYKIFTTDQQSASTFNPDYTPPVYPQSTTYTVKKGDSLWKIAAQKLGKGELWPLIFKASNLRSGNPDLIYPGEVVNIPGVALIQGDITTFTLPFALDNDDYYIYVRATSTRGAKSNWASKSFSNDGSNPGVPGGGTLGGIGTGGGGGFESVIADPETSNAFLAIRDGSNLMSVQQSSFETLTDSIQYTGTNATLAQDVTRQFSSGGASMSITASSAATMSAESTWLEVAEQAPVTVRAQFLAIATARTVNLRVLFYDADFAHIDLQDIEGTGTDSTTTWTEVTATGYTPLGTVYAKVQLEIASPANAEVHNVDHIGLMYGTDSAWSDGGHTSRNLLSASASNADDPAASEPWTATAGSSYTRAATTGTGSDGAKAFKMTLVGATPTISYVSTSTAYTDTSSSAEYTLNKPASVADGDLLVAYVSADIPREATPPTGWTVIDSVQTGSGSTGVTLTVMARDGLAADPSTWAGVFADTRSRCRTVVECYRGAAPVASQFTQGNVSSSLSGSTTVQTATVANTDPTAWRLAAFAVRDNASGGSMTANVLPPSGPAVLSYVGKAAASKDNSSSSSTFTINKPSGTDQDDLMVATLAVACNATVTPPAGWTLVRTVHKTVGGGGSTSGSISLAVMIRTAGSSEPTSWSGSHTSSGRKVTECVAYRGAAADSLQFIDEDGSGSSYATITTPSVTNTDSKSWRISVFANLTDGGSTMTSSGQTERADDTNSGYDPGVNVAVYDSNGTISTGSGSRTAVVSNDYNLYSAASWIGIIKVAASGASPGANETERQDATAGASTTYLTLAAYDSNGVANTGNSTLYGSFTVGSGSGTVSTASWIGFLVPGTATVGGEVGADLASYVDISAVSAQVLNRAGNQMTVQASFLGSTAGTPHLKMYAYIGNELISTQVAEGSPFNTSSWVKSVAQFALPPGTTRLKMGVTAVDRQISDYVYYDRASIAFGSDTVYRPGTGKSAHPIFNIPVIEFSQDLGDGYGDWAELPGTSVALLKYDNLTGVCRFVDQGIVPLSARKYRAKTVSYGLTGDVFTSGYGPVSEEVTLVATHWWIKDVDDPDNPFKLKVKAEPLTVKTTDTSSVFLPLGADLPFVVTEGYKGDQIDLTVIVNRSEYARLRELFNSRRTLYLQSNMDNAWWVRPNGDLTAATQLTGKFRSDPLRFVDVSFVEVEPEV